MPTVWAETLATSSTDEYYQFQKFQPKWSQYAENRATSNFGPIVGHFGNAEYQGEIHQIHAKFRDF